MLTPRPPPTGIGEVGVPADAPAIAIATNFSLGPEVSFQGTAEVGRAVEPAASVENDPKRTISRKAVESPTHPSGTPALRMPSMMRSRWAR